MAQDYYGQEPSGGGFNANNQSTEKSIKSCYAVVYELDNRKWVVAGEGGWSEVHLCEDSLDNSHRILAWTVKSQQVLMNCNVTAECTYKEKSKNFHSFSDENGNRYGLGFHKSESGLKQASHFLKSVISVITQCKSDLNPSPPQAPKQESYAKQPASSSLKASGTPQHPTPSGPSSKSHSPQPPMPNSMQSHQHHQPLQEQPGYTSLSNQNASHSNYNHNQSPYQQQQQQANNNGYHNNNNNQYQPPPAQLQQSRTSATYNQSPLPQYKQKQPQKQQYQQQNQNQQQQNQQNSYQQAARSPSPGPQMVGTPKMNGMKGHNFQPTYHLTKEQHKSIPTVPLGPLGNLKILPPKPQKHFSGDKKIKNPTAVEHKMRVTHDKETGLYSGLPAEWLEHLNKQFGVNPKLLPGIKLDQYPSKIPKVLHTLRSALEDANAYQQVGIFRLAPNASDNKAVKDKIDKGQLNEQEEKVDVNVYANLIKVWFRDLPDPLLNAVNPDLIEHVQSQDDASNVITNFPEPNKSIFLWLCDMCCDIAKFEKTNKMGAENMAIVVAPNLFNTDKFENPMKAMTYSQKVVEFFKHSILWRQKVRGY